MQICRRNYQRPEWKEVRARRFCAICKKPIVPGEKATVDHIYPRSKGGDNGRKNLQCVHSYCNMRKADLIPWAYCRPQDHPWESFDEAVYGVVRRVPWGKVTTYRQVAQLLGDARLAGAVAQALRRAPRNYPRVTKRLDARVRRNGAVPCHRVVGAHGELADYLGSNGAYNHRKMLRREKITIYDDLKVRVGMYGW